MLVKTPPRRWLFFTSTGLGLTLGCALLALSASGSATSPPKVVITSPKDGAVVTEPTVKVTGKITVAPVNGPSPRVVATLNGRQMNISVNGRVSYDFDGKASLTKGLNKLIVAVNDGNGGESEASVTVNYTPILPTRRQCVSDKSGDSHDRLAHMDLVGACATRRGAKVIFSITTAHAPPNIHDGFGNPAAPCFEVFRGALLGHGGPAPIQSCGDAQLRGIGRNWPTVPFGISGRVSTWKVPLKYLPDKKFEWRAYLSEADRYTDKAPDKGFLTFIVK
ncbi:MAG: hypothetical protein WBM00_08020 [Solirubrobacterales bacterium]